MRNNIKTKIGSIITMVEKLPYFSLNNLLPLKDDIVISITPKLSHYLSLINQF